MITTMDSVPNRASDAGPDERRHGYEAADWRDLLLEARDAAGLAASYKTDRDSVFEQRRLKLAQIHKAIACLRDAEELLLR